MPKYTSNRIDLNVGFNVDKSGLDQIRKSFQLIQNIKPGTFKGSADLLRRIQVEAKKVETALTNAFNVKLGSLNTKEFYTQLQKADVLLNKLYADFNKLGAVGQAGFSKLTSSIVSTNLQLRETNSLLQSFGNTMVNTIKWGFASSIINGFTSSVQQAISYVEGLDKSLTNIRIVTGDSREEMAQFADQANRASQALGRSTMDYTKAALSYYQQGLSDEDVAARTEATLKAQNITGAGLEMADYLTAVWNGYKVVNEEAELYVDKMAAVADSSASNMALLATAMSKVASTANMMGVDMDQLNAQIATIVATTRQAPESVGNALKTIYTRINDIKTGSDDALISLGNYTSKMALLGVNVLDASGHLRDTGEVIELIGGKWDTMSREQQIYLSRTMAGQRQINNLLALFDNWSRYSDLVNISMLSQGTTMLKNSRYMESLGAHLNQLNAAQLRLKSSMIDSDSFKGLVDFGTGAVTVFSNLVEAIGGGGIAILGLGSIVTQVFSGMIAKEINAAITNVQTFRNNLDQVAEAERRVQEASAGSLNQGLAKAYLTDLQAMVAAWRGLSNEEKQLQQNRAERLNDLRAEKAILEEQLQTADKLSVALSGRTTGRAQESNTVGYATNQLQKYQNQIKLVQLALNAFYEVSDTGGKRSAEEINAQKEAVKNLSEVITTATQGMKQFATEEDHSLASFLQHLQQSGSDGQKSFDTIIQSVERFIERGNTAGLALRKALGINTTPIKQQLDLVLQQLKRIGAEFEGINEQGIQLNKVQSFVKLASGIGQLTAGISGMVHAIKALKNENLSLGEKVLQVTSGIAMSFGMIYSGWRQITPLIATGITKIVAFDDAMAAGKFVAIAGQKGLTAAIKETNALLSLSIILTGILEAEMLGPFIAIAAAIAGLVLISKGLYDAWNADALAAKKAAQTANEVRLAYDNVKQSADDLKASLDQYKLIQDSFTTLTVGTEEWNEKLRESNLLVLELIQKFPELAQYVSNENGKLIFDDLGLKEYLKQINLKVDLMGAANDLAQSQSRQASINSLATNLGRQDAVLGTALSKDIVLDIANKLIDFQDGNRSEDNLEDFVKNVAALNGNINEKLIQALIDDTSGMALLTSAIRELTNVTEVANEARVKASLALTNSAEYLAASNELRSAMLEITAKTYNAATLKFALDLEKSFNSLGKGRDVKNSSSIKGTGVSGEEVLQAARTFLGDETASWASNSVQKSHGQTLFAFNVGGDEKKVSAAAIADIIAASKALLDLGILALKAGGLISEISLAFGTEDNQDIPQAISKFISGEDFGELTALQLNNLGEVQISPELFDKYKLQFQALGYESAELFNTAFALAVLSDKIKFDNIGKSYLKPVQESFKNFKDKDLTLNASQAIADNLNQAFIHGGEEGLKNLQGILSNLSPDELQDIADILANIDWTQDGAAYQLKEALEEQGIALDENTPGWNNFIELLDKTSSKAQDTAGSIEKLRGVISKLKELSAGEVLDDTAYNELIAMKPELEGLFKLSDLGYMFIGTQLQITESIKNTTQETVNNLRLIESVANQIKDKDLGTKASGVDFDLGYRISQENFTELKDISQDEAFHNAMTALGYSLEGFLKALETILTYRDKRFLSDDQKAEYDEAKQLIQSELELIANMQSQVLSGIYLLQMKQAQSIIATQAQSLEELRNSYYERQILLEDYADMRLMLLEKLIEELGITRELYDATYLQLRDHLEETSESFELLSEALQQVLLDQLTLRVYELGLSLDLLQGISLDTFDNIQEFISKGLSDTPLFATQVGELQAILEGIFQTDIDPSFIALNFDLIRQLALGDITALDDLQMALAQDYLALIRAEVDPTAYGAVDLFSSWLSTYDLDDLYVGATLDDAGFTEMLGILAALAGLTADDINNILAGIGFEPEVIQQEIPFNLINKSLHGNDYSYTWTDPITGLTQLIFLTTDQYDAAQSAGSVTIPIINGKKIKYTGGSKTGNYSRPNYSAPKKSGGNKKSGGKSSTPKAATQAKLNTSKIETKEKIALTNPYLQQLKAFLRQEKILDNLQNKLKKLVNKDRLKNLKDQNKTLEQQVKILNKELDISRNTATENSTANYAKRLKNAFGSVLKFDSDGQISDINALEKASVNTYNAAAKAAADAFEKLKAKYNNYITNTWNKYSTQEQQEANKTEKEYWDLRVKNAEEAAKKAISAALEEYKTREDLIKSYNSAWEADQDRLEKIRDLQDLIIENQIAISKITVDLSIDTGEAEREWLEFEKKFIKKIDDDDFLGQAKASVKELMSYFNSKQIQLTANLMRQLQKEITIMLSGAMSSIYGDNLNAAKERLEELMKQQMDDLLEIQDLVDDIKDNYLDTIDDAKDKMDLQINQYERINDLIDHNVKLTELIYGDKAYETLDKYYNLMQKNNLQELDSLKRQQEYWQERMNQLVIGSDAWLQFKKNLDDTTDNLNDKLEEMIDNLSKKWLNKVDGIIEKLNNGLTGSRGLDYLDEQWDYINNYDDNFLDTVNSVMGTREVERLYKQASDDLSLNPKQQQKINKLMNLQLKILKEKNKLTEYDIERAKALLQVEQARIALEDARNNKTKMRLRRDSQGNYTYQYVADEEKLTELQAALDDAQANLYNMDKLHYKLNLNKLYDTYKDYLERMRALQEEYRKAEAVGDLEEKARIQARIDLMNNLFSKLWEGLSEDNKYALLYLKDSFADGLGIDKAIYSAEEFATIMNQNISQMQSNIQDLQDKIAELGGLINATADAIKNIKEATHSYNEEMNNTLNATGSSVEAIIKATDEYGNALDKNILNTEKFITANEKLITNCHSQIEEIRTLMDLLNNYLDNAMSVESLVSNLRGAYNIDQILNGSKLTADVNIPIEDFNIDTTFSTLDLYQKYLSNMTLKEKLLSSTEIGNIWTKIQNKINSAELGSVDLKTSDLLSMFKAVLMVRNMTNALSGFSANQLASLGMNTLGSLIGTDNNNTIFDQEIHIDAHFPNVTSSDEIIRAIEMLPNMATQKTGYNIN